MSAIHFLLSLWVKLQTLKPGVLLSCTCQCLLSVHGSVTLKRIGFFCFPIKHSTHTDPRHRPPGQQWILGGGLRGGGPGRPPFWRTPKESCKGLGFGDLKINTQHTPVTLRYAVPPSVVLMSRFRASQTHWPGQACQSALPSSHG
jgi:hypothetical protein